MKSIPAPLLACLQSATPTIAHALRITRTDGQVFGFTSAVQGVTISAVAYDASQGLDISSIVTTSGLGVDNLELSTLDDGSLFSRADVIAGVWQNATFLIFRYNWASPGDGIENLMAGTIGQVQLKRGMVVAELRGLQQYLQQPVGNVTSKTCRARFADFPTAAGSNACTLSAATWTDTVTVTAVASRRGFTATGTARAANWYREGIATWLTGANAGLRVKIKAYSGAQVFELLTDMPHDIAIGDTIGALAGCSKRLQEDCRDRFNNVVNFQGEPHLPGLDALTKTPDVSA